MIERHTVVGVSRSLKPFGNLARILDIAEIACMRDKQDISVISDMPDYPIRTPQQLGAVLRGFRRERKLTQQAVGKSAGLAQNAISQIETNPGPTSLARIARVLAALNLELVVRSRKAGDGPSEW